MARNPPESVEDESDEECGGSRHSLRRFCSSNAKIAISQPKTESSEKDHSLSFVKHGSHNRYGEAPDNCLKSEIGGKLLPQNIVLATNMQTCSGAKQYECNICFRMFATYYSLTAHTQRHTKRKCFMCRLCDQSFSTNHNLTAHMRAHTSPKPYHKWEVLGRSNNMSSNPSSRKQIHTGEKDYHCEICNIYFAQVGQLTTHIRTHTGIKPFKCQICKTCLSTKGTLKIHMRNAHSC